MMVTEIFMKATQTPPDKPSFGSEAKRLRLGCQLTAQDLADRAGISREHIRLLEHNYPVPLDSKRRVFRELWAIKAKK